MRRMRVVLGIALVGALALACNAIIGTKDIYPGEDDGGADGSFTGDGPIADGPNGNDGGRADGPALDSSCDANFGSDPQHCGRCGHDCLGGACVDGGCAPVEVLKVGSPRYIALDTTTVYYTDDSFDEIRKVGKDGGAPQKVSAAAGTGANEVTIDGTSAFYTVQAYDGGAGLGAIAQCPLAGGASQVITPPQNYPSQLKLDGTKLYWVQSAANPQPIMVKPLPNGTVTQVAVGDPGGGALSLGIFSGMLYVADDTGGGTLKRCALPGCANLDAGTIWTDINGIGGVLVTSSRIVWSTAVVPATFWQAQLDGGGPEKITVGPPVPHTLALDGTHLYWLNAGRRNSATGDYDQGQVMRCPHAGGVVDCGATGPQTLASGQLFIRSLMLDESAVYWVSGASIWKVAK